MRCPGAIRFAAVMTMTEMSKIGEMYLSTARDPYKSVEKTLEKHKA